MLDEDQINDLEEAQKSLALIREDLFSIDRPSNLIFSNLLGVIKLLDRKIERIYDQLDLSEIDDIPERRDIAQDALNAQKEENYKQK